MLFRILQANSRGKILYVHNLQQVKPLQKNKYIISLQLCLGAVVIYKQVTGNLKDKLLLSAKEKGLK